MSSSAPLYTRNSYDHDTGGRFGFLKHAIYHASWHNGRVADYAAMYLAGQLLALRPSAASLTVREAWRLAQELELWPIREPQLRPVVGM